MIPKTLSAKKEAGDHTKPKFLELPGKEKVRVGKKFPTLKFYVNTIGPC